MKMKTLHILSIACIAMMAMSCASHHYKKGLAEYELLRYNEAVPSFEKALEKKPIGDAYVKLAESYYHMNNSAKAVEWYDSAQVRGVLSGIHELYYAQSLFNEKEYQEAKTWALQYKQTNPYDSRADMMLLSLQRLEEMVKDSSMFRVDPVNGLAEDSMSNFSPVFYENGLLFTTERSEGTDKTYEWTGRPFLDIYYAKKDQDTAFTEVKPFEGPINSIFHEGPGVFSATGDTFYFSRSNVKDGKLRHDRDKFSHIKLYMSVKDGDTWSEPEPMIINVDGASSGHPAISSDGTMYFVSDRQGSKGKTDLWRSVKNPDGTWGMEEHLANLSSMGAEMFPTVIRGENGVEKLVYSSTGQGGLGGLDMFMADINEDGSLGIPRHLTYPLNSSHDDFGFITQDSMKNGYFTSNRASANNQIDQIFSFEALPPELFLKGRVIASTDGQPAEGATVTLITMEQVTEKEQMTDGNGEFEFPIKYNQDYVVTAKKPGYFASTGNISSPEEQTEHSDTIYITLMLDPLDMGRPYSLNRIYYDFDKANIRAGATETLDSLVQVMNRNPEISIELVSHADCRGTEAYNADLALRRAKSAVEYIANKGIAPGRMTAKGYGEKSLVNNCDCSEDSWGTGCSANEHQLNRRTVFRITDIEEYSDLEEVDATFLNGEVKFQDLSGQL